MTSDNQIPQTPLSPEMLVCARLMELVDHRSPWHRALWQTGTLLALREVVEYVQNFRTGICKIEGLIHVAGSAHGQVCRDLGLGPGNVQGQLLTLLSDLKSLSPKGGKVDPVVDQKLQQMIRRIDSTYLQTWRSAVEAGQVSYENCELVSRLLVGHLLDHGFSPDHIHGWLLASEKRRTDDLQPDRKFLCNLVVNAISMFAKGIRKYHVVVCFSDVPDALVKAAKDQGRYFANEDLVNEVTRNNWPALPFGAKRPKAIRFVVEAREPKSAISAAEIEVRRLASRVGVGLLSSAFELEEWALVYVDVDPQEDERPPAKWHQFSARPHNFLLTSIQRHDLLLPADRVSTLRALEDAVELLANAETTTSWTAVASMWAAVEGLLVTPGEPGVGGADRMASITAGGYARAELTTLVDRFAMLKGEFGDQMRDKATPLKARFDLILSAMDSATLPEVADAQTVAALRRLAVLKTDPRGTLERIRGYFMDALRRLYMQRNLLLHGGRFDSVALPATARTLPPIVAAGLDRIIHAGVQAEGSTPVALAARVDLEITLSETSEATPLYALLD